MPRVPALRRTAKVAALGLGGSLTASLLLVAARMAALPGELSGIVPPSALGAVILLIAASYLIGAAANAYTLYGYVEEWNRLVDETLRRLERLADLAGRAGDPGYSSLDIGRLSYYASSRKMDSLTWSMASMPPLVGLVSLLGISRLIDHALSLRRELSLTSSAMLRKLGRRRVPGYGEAPPKPVGLLAASFLGYPLLSVYHRLEEYLELYRSSMEEHLGLVEEALSGMLIEEEANRGRGMGGVRPRAWIITIGNEVLSGHTVNTNAAWLGRKLTMLGYLVERAVTCMDDLDHIVEVFRDALRHKPSVVVSTGGLGPTFDDKTSEALARALGREWVVNEEALRMVEEKYRSAGLEMTEHRVKLAKMPRGARPLPNPVGTAPGILVEEGDTLIAALPGVPAEMKGIFEESLEPLLRERGPRIAYLEKEIIVRGVPESTAAPVIERAMKLSPRLYIKSHPSGIETTGPVLTIQIIATGDTREEAEETIRRAEGFLREELGRLGGAFEETAAGGEG